MSVTVGLLPGHEEVNRELVIPTLQTSPRVHSCSPSLGCWMSDAVCCGCVCKRESHDAQRRAKDDMVQKNVFYLNAFINLKQFHVNRPSAAVVLLINVAADQIRTQS